MCVCVCVQYSLCEDLKRLESGRDVKLDVFVFLKRPLNSFINNDRARRRHGAFMARIDRALSLFIGAGMQG